MEVLCVVAEFRLLRFPDAPGLAPWRAPARPGLRPYWSVKSTRRVESRILPPAIHTNPPAHPLTRQRLAARPPGCPWHTSGSGRGGSDPPRRRLGTGSGRGGNSHLAPRPPRVAPAPSVPAGRPVKRRFEALDHTLAVPSAAGAAGGLVPARLAVQPLRSNATGRSIRFCTTLNPTFRFRRFGLDGPIHSQPGIRPSR